MKLRIKYEKTGCLRFIGHLDVMRFFQKAIRRAKLDVAYSQGFSPHQIISFAAPMPLGMTSEGEYFDGEFNSVTTTEDMVTRLNATMPDGIRVHDIVMLPDNAGNSMSVVTASDYYIYTNDESNFSSMNILTEAIDKFMALSEVNIMKKTKSKEEIADIRPYIYEVKKYEDGIYVLLASGSRVNLKPELVIEALCNTAGVEYDRYDYRIHRLETYMGESDSLVSLAGAGVHF